MSHTTDLISLMLLVIRVKEKTSKYFPLSRSNINYMLSIVLKHVFDFIMV
jgi:hypothetical protein